MEMIKRRFAVGLFAVGLWEGFGPRNKHSFTHRVFSDREELVKFVSKAVRSKYFTELKIEEHFG